MEAKLIVIGGKANKSEVKLKLPTIIGRSRSADLTVSHPKVSRQHCQIFERDGALIVRDNGSLNGTFVENQRVTEAVLRPGDKLTIGPLTFVAVYEHSGAFPQVAVATPQAQRAAIDPDFETPDFKATAPEGSSPSRVVATPAPVVAEEPDWFAEEAPGDAALADLAEDKRDEEPPAGTSSASPGPLQLDETADFGSVPPAGAAAKGDATVMSAPGEATLASPRDELSSADEGMQWLDGVSDESLAQVGGEGEPGEARDAEESIAPQPATSPDEAPQAQPAVAHEGGEDLSWLEGADAGGENPLEGLSQQVEAPPLDLEEPEAATRMFDPAADPAAAEFAVDPGLVQPGDQDDDTAVGPIDVAEEAVSAAAPANESPSELPFPIIVDQRTAPPSSAPADPNKANAGAKGANKKGWWPFGGKKEAKPGKPQTADNALAPDPAVAPPSQSAAPEVAQKEPVAAPSPTPAGSGKAAADAPTEFFVPQTSEQPAAQADKEDDELAQFFKSLG